MAEEHPPKQRNPAEHLKPYQFKKGISGNPNGRPKGAKSLKTYAREFLEALPDDEKLDYMEGMDKKIIWEMAEGKAENKVDVTTDGKEIQGVVILPAKDSD